MNIRNEYALLPIALSISSTKYRTRCCTYCRCAHATSPSCVSAPATWFDRLLGGNLDLIVPYCPSCGPIEQPNNRPGKAEYSSPGWLLRPGRHGGRRIRDLQRAAVTVGAPSHTAHHGCPRSRGRLWPPNALVPRRTSTSSPDRRAQPSAMAGRLSVTPAYSHSSMRTGYSWRGSMKPFNATLQKTTTSALAANLISGSVD
jgi:hypothetical protein